jgi:hypothetical protein
MPWLVSGTFAEVFTLWASTTAAVGSALRPWARRVLSRNRSWTPHPASVHPRPLARNNARPKTPANLCGHSTSVLDGQVSGTVQSLRSGSRAHGGSEVTLQSQSS